MATVRGTFTRADGTPWVGLVVRIRPMQDNPQRVPGKYVIPTNVTATADSNGVISVNLIPSTEYNPVTPYIFEFDDPGSVQEYRLIGLVPDSNIDIRDINAVNRLGGISLPTGSITPSMLSLIAGQSAEGDKYLKTNSTGNLFELVDGAGGGGASLSDSTPQTIGSASPGSSTEASRSDHSHPRGSLHDSDIPSTIARDSELTNRLAALELDDLSNVANTSPTDNQVLTYDNSTSKWGPESHSGLTLSDNAALQVGSSGASGTSVAASRDDHVHAAKDIVDADIPSGIARDSEISDWAKASNTDALPAAKVTNIPLSDAVPQQDTGSGSSGSATTASRSDHRHQGKELVDADIPAGIARDTEVENAVNAHASDSGAHTLTYEEITLTVGSSADGLNHGYDTNPDDPDNRYGTLSPSTVSLGGANHTFNAISRSGTTVTITVTPELPTIGFVNAGNLHIRINGTLLSFGRATKTPESLYGSNGADYVWTGQSAGIIPSSANALLTLKISGPIGEIISHIELDELQDVHVDGAANNQVLGYTASSQRWEPKTPAGGATPYASAPPAIADNGSPGSSSEYSRGDHTHEAKDIVAADIPDTIARTADIENFAKTGDATVLPLAKIANNSLTKAKLAAGSVGVPEIDTSSSGSKPLDWRKAIGAQDKDTVSNVDTAWEGTITGVSAAGDVKSDGGADDNLGTGTNAADYAITISGNSGSIRQIEQDGTDNDISFYVNGAIDWTDSFRGHALDINGNRFLFDHTRLTVPSVSDGYTEFNWSAAAGVFNVGSNSVEIYTPVTEDNFVPGGASENEIMTFDTTGKPVVKDMNANVLLAGSGETVVTGRTIETGTRNADGSYSLRTRASAGQGGVGGQSGLSAVETVFLWRRATAKPADPTGGVWDNGWTTVPTGWHTSPSGPTGSDTLWRAIASVTASGASWTVGAWTVVVAEAYNTRYSIYLTGRDSTNTIVATSTASASSLAFDTRDPDTGAWRDVWVPLHPRPGFTGLGSVSITVSSKTNTGHLSFTNPVDLAAIETLRFRIQLNDSLGSAHYITNFDLDPGTVWVAPYSQSNAVGIALNQSLVAIATETGGLTVFAGTGVLPSTNNSLNSFACKFLIRQTHTTGDPYSNAGDIFIYEWGGTGQHGTFSVSYQ